MCMILINFQIFALVRKKHSTIFFYSDLKCPFIKFSINTLHPQDISSSILCYCSTLSSSSLSTSNTRLFAGHSSAKFEEKLTCGLENDMRNLADFHQNT